MHSRPGSLVPLGIRQRPEQWQWQHHHPGATLCCLGMLYYTNILPPFENGNPRASHLIHMQHKKIGLAKKILCVLVL